MAAVPAAAREAIARSTAARSTVRVRVIRRKVYLNLTVPARCLLKVQLRESGMETVCPKGKGGRRRLIRGQAACADSVLIKPEKINVRKKKLNCSRR